MKTLEIDIDSVKAQNNTLAETITSFQESIPAFTTNGTRPYVAEIDNLLGTYKTNINTNLTNLSEKLTNYVDNVLNYCVSLYTEIDEATLTPSIDTDMAVPTSLSNMVVLNQSWYSYDDTIAANLSGIDAVVGTAFIGSLANVVTSGTPQALDEFNNYIVGTNSNGNLYIYDKTTQETKIVNLGSDYHLGGVSYNNGNLYVATGGKISRYNFENLLAGDTTPVAQYSNVETTTNVKNTVSFLTTTSAGNLVTGIFKNKGQYNDRGSNDSELIVYDIADDGSINTEDYSAYSVPDGVHKIQGVCVYEHNGQDYYFLTSSNSTSDSSRSTLYVATLEGNQLVTQSEYTLPAGAEQISVTSDNNVAVIYEGKTSRENITVLDPEILINGGETNKI